MPPKSRKRNKGKDRKAKKLEIERAKAHDAWWAFTTLNISNCDHGCTIIPNDSDHPVSKFLDELYLQITEMDDGMEVFRSTFDTHPHIWNDTNNRKLLLNTLVRIGTNMLIASCNLSRLTTGFVANWRLSSKVATIILIFHEYIETMSIGSAFLSQHVITKRRDLAPDISSFKRDALKFYRKRVSCNCLKRMHLEARKTLPKMGKCGHCRAEKVRAHLFVCSSV